MQRGGLSASAPCLDVTTSPVRRTRRLPREGGTPGGGTLKVQDRTFLEEGFKPKDEWGADSPTGSQSSHAGKSKKDKKSSGEVSGLETGDESRDESGLGSSQKDRTSKPRMTPDERRRMELLAKWEKTEAARQRDFKSVAERLDRNHDWREARFKRLHDAIQGSDGLAYELAMQERDREAHQEARRRTLHAEFEEKVWYPMAVQAHERMNPPNREREQRLAGSKSVSFDLPNDTFRLSVNLHDDPAKKVVMTAAKENAFHRLATTVLQTSHSSPVLGRSRSQSSSAGSSPSAPGAMSRPVLEPTVWGQQAIQGTLYGHFAQVCDHGPGFVRGRRGGSDVFVPDESDGLLAAGTRKHPDGSYHDKGVLRGDTGVQGESFDYKTIHGASCAAPAQDHYTFETGTRITSLEFPPGKRMNPNFH